MFNYGNGDKNKEIVLRQEPTFTDTKRGGSDTDYLTVPGSYDTIPNSVRSRNLGPDTIPLTDAGPNKAPIAKHGKGVKGRGKFWNRLVSKISEMRTRTRNNLRTIQSKEGEEVVDDVRKLPSYNPNAHIMNDRINTVAESFEMGSYPKVADLSPSQQAQERELQRALKALRKVQSTTDSRFDMLFKSVGEKRKKLLSNIERFGKKFNKLPLSVRLGAGFAIAAIGATGGAAFALPVVALTLVSRAAAGAGTYATIQAGLRSYYARNESKGNTISFLKKGTLETGAVALAACGGYYLSQLIGGLLEGSSSAVDSLKDSVFGNDAAPLPVQNESTPPLETKETTSTTSNLDSPTKEPQTLIMEPSPTHTVRPNERLWDIVRERLSTSSAGDTFKGLTPDAKNVEIAKYVDYIDKQKIIPNVNLIHPGDVIDFSKIEQRMPDHILKHVTKI